MYQKINATIIIKSSDVNESNRGKIDPMLINKGDFLPDLQTVIKASRYFRDAGFKVWPHQDSINIEGSLALFESIFGNYWRQGTEKAGVHKMLVPALLKDILVRVIFSDRQVREPLLHS